MTSQTALPVLAIPDLEALLSAVRERAPIAGSYVHGDHHWRAVAEVGLRLLEDNMSADPDVVFLFALFHDAGRENEHTDPGHGRRGAAMAATMRADGLLKLADDRFNILLEACSAHTESFFSDHATIGVCFDADRLNLWRVGTTPNPKMLSTDAAIDDDQLIHWSKSIHGRARDWDRLLEAYWAAR
jgi:uncharacterized protein